MTSKFRFALVLSTSLFAGAAWSEVVSDVAPVSELDAVKEIDIKDVFSELPAATNYALIIQSSNKNAATIEQIKGSGNYAEINQSGSQPSAAYILQSGSNNRALIKQR